MQSKTPASIKQLPILGYTLRLISSLALLPRRLQQINNRLSFVEENSGLLVDNHGLDIFYTKFEDKFRGREEDIKKRLEVYKKDFISAKIDFNQQPVLDIGCGRGEFLQLMKEIRINAVGVDLNKDMVARSNKKGLDVRHANAVNFMNEQGSSSIGAITGFHIVEHIPFPKLLELFTACYQSLADDGFVIFETPNPKNVTVGSCGFYMDPSHLHPLPPELLKFSLESCGFSEVEIRYLHPAEVTAKEWANVPQQLKDAFTGPRDYAVIAHKK